MIVRSGETDLWRFELRATPAERLIEAGYFGVNPVWRHESLFAKWAVREFGGRLRFGHDPQPLSDGPDG